MKFLIATILAFDIFFSSFNLVSGLSQPVQRDDQHFGGCAKYCPYVAHSVQKCDKNHPCGFQCVDGFSPYPSYNPTKCVCNKPYTECNGKCGIFKGCPSKGHYRRELSTEATCPKDFTACGILGRHTGSWECINTQKDLESCGGCMVSLDNNIDNREGQDCTAIPGVADVSCNKGFCVVNRCMPGFDVDATGTSCATAKQKSPLTLASNILAAEFGLEHGPL